MLTHNEILEIGKIMSDFFKQMITLDTGMIILVITIVEKVFTTEKVFKSGINRILLILTVSSFIVSLLFSLNALVVIPTRITILLYGGVVDNFVDSGSLNGTIYLFILGVALFIGLAIRSVYSSFAPDDLAPTHMLKK